MNDSTIQAFAERLTTLERENRRWRRAGITLAALGVAALLAGGARLADEKPKDVLTAKRFVLRDDEGLEKGVFFVGESGEPRLEFKDARGTTLIALGISPSDDQYQARLDLLDQDGRLRITLALAAGDPGLFFYRPDGDGIVSVFDSEPMTALDVGRISFGSYNHDEGAWIRLRDGDGELRAKLGLGGNGFPNLELRGEEETKLRLPEL